MATSPTVSDGFPDITVEEQAALDRVTRYMAEGAGYGAIQATRPNTVGIWKPQVAVSMATATRKLWCRAIWQRDRRSSAS